MKTINQLEQESKQAREELCVEMVSYLPISSKNAGIIADKLILASVAMVTYQLAQAEQLRNGKIIKIDSNSTTFTIPEKKSVEIYAYGGGGSGGSSVKGNGLFRLENLTASQHEALVNYLSGNSSKSLPEVSQEERDSDGWINWGGGLCPVDTEIEVEYKMRFSEDVHFSKALYLEWGKDIVERDWDIVAYRIVKG